MFGSIISFFVFFFSPLCRFSKRNSSEYSDSVFKEFPDEAKVDFVNKIDIERGWGYSSIDRELA